jgi:hypothetical protein
MYDFDIIKKTACKVGGISEDEYNLRRDEHSVYIRTMVSGFAYYYGSANMMNLKRMQRKSYANELNTLNNFNNWLETNSSFRKLYRTFLRELSVDSVPMERYFDARRPDRIAYHRFANRIKDRIGDKCVMTYAIPGHKEIVADFYVPERNLLIFVLYGQYKIVQQPGKRDVNYFDMMFRKINSANILGYNTMIILPEDVESFDVVARVKQYRSVMEKI